MWTPCGKSASSAASAMDKPNAVIMEEEPSPGVVQPMPISAAQGPETVLPGLRGGAHSFRKFPMYTIGALCVVITLLICVMSNTAARLHALQLEHEELKSSKTACMENTPRLQGATAAYPPAHLAVSGEIVSPRLLVQHAQVLMQAPIASGASGDAHGQHNRNEEKIPIQGHEDSILIKSPESICASHSPTPDSVPAPLLRHLHALSESAFLPWQQAQDFATKVASWDAQTIWSQQLCPCSIGGPSSWVTLFGKLFHSAIACYGCGMPGPTRGHVGVALYVFGVPPGGQSRLL